MLKKLIVCCLTLVLCIACTKQVLDNKHHIRFAIPNNMVAALVVVAQAQGYFTAENITLEPQTVTNGKMANDLLLANQADMAAGADGPFTWLSFGEHPLRIVAQMLQDKETGIFARKDSGINTEADLKGKRLGYLPGTVSFLYLAELIEQKGWTLDDFKLAPLQPPAMPQALMGKQIDAFSMWEPWGYNAIKQLGNNGVILRQPDLYHFVSMVVVRNDFIKANPAAVKGVLRALIKAEQFVAANPQKAIKIWAEAFKLDEAYLTANQNLYNFKVQLDDSLVKKMDRNAMLIKKYMPDYAEKPVPHFKPLVLDSYLREVDATRVTLKK
jgi:NitT/TauT family transport system substrate-binding protein